MRIEFFVFGFQFFLGFRGTDGDSEYDRVSNGLEAEPHGSRDPKGT